MWSQLQNLCTPVDQLRDADHQLADDLVCIAKALNSASTRDDSSASSDQLLSVEQAMQHHHRIATEWDTLVDRAKTIPGFEDIFRPKKFTKLKNAA